MSKRQISAFAEGGMGAVKGVSHDPSDDPDREGDQQKHKEGGAVKNGTDVAAKINDPAGNEGGQHTAAAVSCTAESENRTSFPLRGRIGQKFHKNSAAAAQRQKHENAADTENKQIEIDRQTLAEKCPLDLRLFEKHRRRGLDQKKNPCHDEDRDQKAHRPDPVGKISVDNACDDRSDGGAGADDPGPEGGLFDTDDLLNEHGNIGSLQTESQSGQQRQEQDQADA